MRKGQTVKIIENYQHFQCAGLSGRLVEFSRADDEWLVRFNVEQVPEDQRKFLDGEFKGCFWMARYTIRDLNLRKCALTGVAEDVYDMVVVNNKFYKREALEALV